MEADGHQSHPRDKGQVARQGLQLLSLRRFLRTLQRPQRHTWRANRKKPPEALLSRPFQKPPTPWSPDGFYEEAEEPGSWMEQYTGEVYIQELASMLPVEVLKAFLPLHSVRILDLCSAPGSKASQLALELTGESVLMCNEAKTSRAQILRCNLLKTVVADRCLILQEDGRHLAAAGSACFDAILLDAPCSGEGNLRRIPEVIERIQAPNYGRIKAENASLQKQLLQSAWRMLRPGGFLVYSTCTLNLQENEEVLEHLPMAEAEFMDLPARLGFPSCSSLGLRLWPHHWDSEGFFVACIRKRGGGGQSVAAPTPRAPWPWSTLSWEEWNDLRAEATDDWPDLTPSEVSRVARYRGDLFLLPPLNALNGLDHLLPMTTPALRLAPLELRLHGARAAAGEDWVALAAQLGGGLGAYTAQMDALVQRGAHWQSAVQIFDRLGEERLKADLIACNTLMKAYSKGGAAGAARKLLKQMRSWIIAPDVTTYAAAMKAADAEELFQDLREDGLQPDVITYTVLMGAYAKRGRRAKAEAALRDMSRDALQPDVIAYTALLDLYAKLGDLEALRRLLATMAPNVVSFTVLLKALVKLQRLQEAQETLEEMQLKRMANLISYTSLLSAFAKKGQHPMTFVTFTAAIFARLNLEVPQRS
ncbi:unnamed protein product [Cladocopium goreaui]|uniref:Ribosomal RNA small subunit methyltransferase F n=1 Tax=Cladocopium goreaui TaxID=2562237 RepID=A0A9P1CX02_9DINO|nr:unnamed protein product [Cladocopium goreaui]